jgi:8-hydroxy-5-deazaflavin:NADPH oxidoreductase
VGGRHGEQFAPSLSSTARRSSIDFSAHRLSPSIRECFDSRPFIIICTNPLASDFSGLVVGTNDSAGEEVARWAKGAKVVKAFNTIGAPNFANPRFGAENASMFICGDDASAKSAVGKLAAELGLDVVDTGPLSASRWLEPLAMLWIHLAFKQGLGPTGHAFKLLRR